ncbi:MAG: nickel pincer cofactor biosynthesis protein LarC [Candidatus Binatia bacterium]|nr:nickel pincer cofactor biosynthesis protein LarC [Candidatus Binatia bacterium]
MRILYFDAFAGVSGDMTVGALLSLGLPLDEVRRTLDALPLGEYEVRAFPRMIHGIRAYKFEVQVPAQAPHVHRAFRDIRAMIESARIDPRVQKWALQIFHHLAVAEGRVHNVPPEDVTFHEVGAVDSIIDIVATAVGLQHFQIEAGYVRTLPLGSGFVSSQHGVLPAPGPATVELVRGFPVHFGDGEGELVTPTGAAIVATVCKPGPPPPLAVLGVGYGAGAREWSDRPNLLRLVLGEPAPQFTEDELMVVETNIDDMPPQWFDWVFERLFAAGARDVWLTPAQMKKNRPASVLHVLSDAAAHSAVMQVLLNETTSLGVRSYPVRRHSLIREERVVSTPYGEVRIKAARMPDGRWNLVPEYEDCKRLAHEVNVPLKLVYQAALAAARREDS